MSITPPHELTWADIEREALHCPILNRLRYLDAMDSPLTREQVMIWTLLWFSRARRKMIDREVEWRMNEPCGRDIQPHIICTLCGAAWHDSHPEECPMSRDA